jgi:hypothetical protein
MGSSGRSIVNSLFVKDFGNKSATALLVHFCLMFALVGWGGGGLLVGYP